ncbi:class I SAM-dependent methyltransferase [Collimonas fungivorans]|uniref:class I SAM-dependent methyltransferase n=1 Tax=Collimonas fungivorans TaxID=158899 RepID=UPI003FA38504
MDAVEWERTAMEKRPWRLEFFDAFAEQIGLATDHSEVLELGSGPGFLAAHILGKLPQLRLHLLDFSEAMHALARARLGSQADLVHFIVRSFRDPSWSDGLGAYDCIITNQAVHELRHKRYAPELHRAVKSLLHPNGTYLVCDHYAGDGGMKNHELYMTIEEQRAALYDAGYATVEQLLCKGGLILHRAV